MTSVDPRVRELFVHLRRVVDIIEGLMLRPSTATCAGTRAATTVAVPVVALNSSEACLLSTHPTSAVLCDAR
jgi:hypothetical protein